MRRYYFTEKSKGFACTSSQFRSHNEALNFVRREASNASTLMELRLWASRSNRGVLSDRQMFERAAGCLVSGQLFVNTWAGLKMDRIASSGTAGGTAESEDFAPPPQSYRPPPEKKSKPEEIRVRKPEPPKQTPKSKPPMNIEQQVTALRAAAVAGAPFCEQCARDE